MGAQGVSTWAQGVCVLPCCPLLARLCRCHSSPYPCPSFPQLRGIAEPVAASEDGSDDPDANPAEPVSLDQLSELLATPQLEGVILPHSDTNDMLTLPTFTQQVPLAKTSQTRL